LGVVDGGSDHVYAKRKGGEEIKIADVIASRVKSFDPFFLYTGLLGYQGKHATSDQGSGNGEVRCHSHSLAMSDRGSDQ